MQGSITNAFFLAALLGGAFLHASSCKKEKDPDPAADAAMAADGSGFKDVFSADYRTDFDGPFRVPDFTIEGTKLHIVYATTVVSQQSNRYLLFRRTTDMAGGGTIPQPDGADTTLEGFNLPSSEYGRGPALFLPYRNFFTYSSYRQSGSALSSSFGGDLQLNWSRASGSFRPSLGFRYPVNNGSDDGCIGTGPAPTPLSYQFKAYQPKALAYGPTYAPHTYLVILEGYRNSFQDSIIAFGFGADSITAYTMVPDASGKLLPYHKVAGIASFPSVVGTGAIPGIRGDRIIRHYDPTGNKLTVAIIADRAYTFTFDFTTRVLARGVDDVAIPHTDLDNFDADEEGNLYYADKSAGFGATTVRKRTPAGATSVVGANKPLRYGEIVRVKYLLGKLYIAASGLPAGAADTHLAVLQQQ